MKKNILICAILLFLNTNTYAFNRLVQIQSVYDGDTVRIILDELPPPLNKLYIRLNSLNTPETTWRAKCHAERLHGEIATEVLFNLLKRHGNSVKLTNFKWDKYGGRINADIYIQSKLTNTLIHVNEYMLTYKHKGKLIAFHYTGKGKKKDWCSYLEGIKF